MLNYELEYYEPMYKYFRKEGRLLGKYDNKDVVVVSMWGDEDSCSPITHHRIKYFFLENPLRMFRGHFEEFLPDYSEREKAGVIRK